MADTGVVYLGEAIDEYLASIAGFTASTLRGYSATLRELAEAFPATPLAMFEPPEGTELLVSWLDQRFGELAPSTYNKSASVVRVLFRRQHEQGRLTSDPAALLQRRSVERKSRNVISDEERDAVLSANAAPWDSVPLRLFLDWGMTKGTVQALRFRDFDASERAVTFVRARQMQTLAIDDDAFWGDFERLRVLRSPAPDDYIAPLTDTSVRRRSLPSQRDLDAMKTDGILEGGRRYVVSRRDGSWCQVVLTPDQPRGVHALHDWWYGCLEEAGLVPPGTTKGFPIMRARHSVGRALYAGTGSFKAVRQTLGVGRGGTTSEVYANRDADQLDLTLRRVRRALRTGLPATRTSDVGPASRSWWLGPNPIRRLTDYIEEERDLIELSRVGIEMLRGQDKSSPSVQEAAATLTRAVSGLELITRAEAEASDDHPLLHGHSLVAIWGALETMAMGVVAAWLTYRPESRSDKVADLRVPYAMFEELSPEDRVDALVHELDQQRGARKGVARFETLLGWVSLSGSTDPILARNLYEMQQVRNVFAHRRGIADRRFIEACPSFGYSVDDQILLSRDAWHDAMIAALGYTETLLLRMKHELGFDGGGRRTRSPAIRWTTSPA